MAVDMFLRLDGIKGESQDSKHKDEIHIESFSWGMSQAGAFGAGGTGRASVHDISITKRIDKSTPLLMLSCANGKHIPTGLITVRKAGDKPVEYLKIKLEDILISSVQMAGKLNGTPSDAVALDVKKMYFSYYQQAADGTLMPPITAIIENFEQGTLEPPPVPPA